jgi:hypothetical protein
LACAFRSTSADRSRRQAQVRAVRPCRSPAWRLHGGGGLDAGPAGLRWHGTVRTARVPRRAFGSR